MLIANDLCRQAAVTGRIVLRSSGMAWRNFVGMADVVAALRHVMTASAERLGDGLFHLGGPRSLRIADLAAMVAERAQATFGRKVDVARAQLAPGENHAELDWRIGRLVATGWTPSSGLEPEIDTNLRLCRDAFGVPA
jgi:UDP-glucose 4-epimerase